MIDHELDAGSDGGHRVARRRAALRTGTRRLPGKHLFTAKRGSGGFPLGTRHVYDGQGNEDPSCLARTFLDGVHEDRAVGEDGGIAKEFKFLAIEPHLALLTEA